MRSSVIVGCAAIAATVSMFANAAGADRAGDSTSTPSQSNAKPADSLEEIIVTANKREQNLNDVGATVDVLGAEALKENHISTLQDIAQSVPGLSYSVSSNGTPIYTLRGVGFNESSISAYPTVTTYLDEAPLSFSVLTRHSAYDLQRIEVLKGPQGTLFGTNATGGAINYVAAMPTRTPEAGVDISYGSFDQTNVEAYVSGPLSETVGARVSGRVERGSAWQRSVSRPGDTNGSVDNVMGRLLLTFEPTSAAHIKLNINAWKDKSDTQAPQLVGLNFQLPIHDPWFATLPFAPANARAADWGAIPTSSWAISRPEFRPSSNNSMTQLSLRGDFDLSENLTLTSLTSYVNYIEHQSNEADGTPISVADVVSNGKVKDFYQELRLGNGSKGAIRWVVGGNYQDSDVSQFANFYFSGTSTANTFFAAAGVKLDSDLFSNVQTIRSVAGFGNAEFDVAPRVTIKAGGRYTDSRQDAALCSADITGDPAGTGVALAGPGYVRGACFTINNLPQTINGVPQFGTGLFKGNLNESNVSWRLGVDFKAAEHALLYANISKGYKQGGFASISASIFEQYLGVKQESVLAYEAGLKATMLDGHLQANGAVFYYDYKDKQLRSKIDPPLFGIQDAIRNIPKSSISGFEFDLTARPLPNLNVGAAFTYLNAKIDQYTNFLYADSSGNPIITNFSGSQIPFTPKYQAGLNASYEVPLGNALRGFIGADVSYRSSAVSIVGGQQDPPALISPYKNIFGIPSYSIVNARLGVKSADSRWALSVFGKNITNKYYWNNVISANDIIARFTGMPATYGVDVAFKFQ